MRAWSVFIFILAIHASLALVYHADITNSLDLNYTFDTSSHSGSYIQIPGKQNVSIPQSDRFFDATKNDSTVYNNSANLKPGDFVGDFIQSVTGVGSTLTKLMTMVGDAFFTIQWLMAPIFGSFNAWVVEGLVDIIWAGALFQMVTGRNFKGAE
jgi:hypothetical protein